jgi:hypothetical protein
VSNDPTGTIAAVGKIRIGTVILDFPLTPLGVRHNIRFIRYSLQWP